MGGYGSGRTSKVGRRPRKRGIVEHTIYLNSFQFMPNKIAKVNGTSCLKINSYKIWVSKEKFQIFAETGDLLLSSPMRPVYSGKGTRYYFSCPMCGIRTSRLYIKQQIACRNCLNLSYHSQNISNEDRWLLRRERLLKRNGLTFQDIEHFRRKKGMHHTTFKRILREYQFISDIGINIHLNRFEYKRCFQLLRQGRRNDFYQTLHSQLTLARFTL